MAVAYLTGVLEDGTQPRPRTLPTNNRQTLTVTQGQTTQVIVTVTTSAGVPVTTGAVTLAIGRAPGDVLVGLTGQWAPLLGAGTAVFTIHAGTLVNLPWGRYIYDVALDQSGVRNWIVPASPLVLAPAV